MRHAGDPGLQKRLRDSRQTSMNGCWVNYVGRLSVVIMVGGPGVYLKKDLEINANHKF